MKLNMKIFDSMKRLLSGIVAMSVFMALSSCGTEYQRPEEGSQKGFAISFFKNVVATQLE